VFFQDLDIHVYAFALEKILRLAGRIFYLAITDQDKSQFLLNNFTCSKQTKMIINWFV